MATLLVVRHGRTKANADGVLTGWTPGVGLDDTGREQANAMAARLSALPITAIVSSPLQRCQETAATIKGPTPMVDDRLGEVRYGDWQGRKLSELSKEELWPVVQQHPSAVTFPGEGGESMAAMSARAIEAVREWDRRIEAEHGPDAIWVAVSHGDVIKAITADALGLHLDQFQRIVIDPCSVTIIGYAPLRPFVVRTNDIGSDLTSLVPAKPRPPGASREAVAESDAQVGGGVGSES